MIMSFKALALDRPTILWIYNNHHLITVEGLRSKVILGHIIAGTSAPGWVP